MPNHTRAWRRAGPIAIALLVLGCGGGDERAIRARMDSIAQALTVPANEGELGRIARIASLSSGLAETIEISTGVTTSAGATGSEEFVGRDAVLGLAARWAPPAGGVTVEFVDVQVTLGGGAATAQVYCTAQAMSGPAERPLVDARELTVGLSKIDGEWLVSSVRPEATLAR